MSGTMSIDPRKVAAYIRWSTDDQSEGTTLAVQTESCRLYIQSQGWEWKDDLCFVDEGYSGGNLDRPAMTALRKAVQDDRVDCVVVYKLDRLSRSVVDTVNLVLEEWEGRCFLKSSREPIDTATPAGKMFFYMLVSYAEWERSVIRERTLAGKKRRAQEGKNPGITLAYGYTRGDRAGDIAIVPDQAAVVRRIYNEYLRGKGLRHIAEELNGEGIPTKSGTPWRTTSVRHILRNEAYKGVLAYGKSTRSTKKQQAAGKKSREVHEKPLHAVVDGAFPVIVEPALWEEAQHAARQRAQTPRRALPGTYLLSGMAKCKCGGPLIGNVTDNGRYRYYQCSLYTVAGRYVCSAKGIPANDLEADVVKAVQAEYGPSNRTVHAALVKQDLSEQIQVTDAAVTDLAKASDSMARTLRRLHHDYDHGELPARLYAQRVEDLEAERGRIAATLEELKDRRERLLEQMNAVDTSSAKFDDVCARIQAWESLSRDEQKQVLRHVVEQLVVWREGEERDPKDRRRVRAIVQVELVLRRIV